MTDHLSPELPHRDAITGAVADCRRSLKHLHAALVTAVDDGVQARVVASTLGQPETTTRRWIENGVPDPWDRQR